MNLSKQIKKYRERDQLSQEELAEKIYVSRQTISNWENERSYPDIHNLLLMSVLFDTSLDDLVKGDVEVMKKELQVAEWNKWTILMVGFLAVGCLSIGPSVKFLGKWGLVLSGVLLLAGFLSSLKLEKLKKDNQVKTYSEIVAFFEGKEKTEVTANQKKKDRLTFLASICVFAIAGAVLSFLSVWLFR